MSRIGITFTEVKQAIIELQGRQKNPTVDNIRAILGTGSKSTIARFLREWKAQHGLSSHNEGRWLSGLLNNIQHAHEALKKQDQAQSIELATLQRMTIKLQLNIKSRDARIASQEEAITKANDKIEILRHENQFALQEKASLEGQLKRMQVMLSSDKLQVVG